MPDSAGFPAQVFNLQGCGGLERFADWKSAIQQAEGLRYVAQIVQDLGGVNMRLS